MPTPAEIQAIINEAIDDVFAAALPRLRAEIARQAADELEARVTAAAATESPSATEKLNAAFSSLQETASQADILHRLLEAAAQFAGRAALFVVKGGSIAGWQAQGFTNNDAIKSFTLSTSNGLVAQAIQDRTPTQGTAASFDQGFAGDVGSPAGENCLILPLVVKQKVAAIVYADPGTAAGGSLDTAALDLLTRMAAQWIEIVALRKAAPAAVEEARPEPEPAPAAPPKVEIPPEDAEVHKKARRFAKLLVEEIKLYNTAKVEKGRQNKDLYARLKDDIDKSRATYDKRYGETPAASVDHFSEELVRVLADNDTQLMGAGFPRA